MFTLSVKSFQMPATPLTSAWPPSLDLALHVDGDRLREIAIRDGGGDQRDVAHLVGQVGCHEVHVVGEVLPSARHAADFRLASQFPLGADLFGDAGDFRSEGTQLIHHRVDRVLQLGDFASDVDGDLLRQVSVGNRGGDLGDVADLIGEVSSQQVDVVSEVLPGARDTLHLGLAPQLALGAHLLGDPGDFGSERTQLIHHRVDGVLQLVDFSLRVDTDLTR